MEQKITIPEGYELQKVNDSEYRIVKKEAELPNSWEEFCETYYLEKEEAVINSKFEVESVGWRAGEARNKAWTGVLPNKEYAEAILALCQLIQLRDYYRQGWKPNYTNVTEFKYGLEFYRDDIRKWEYLGKVNIFSFQSSAIRDKFYNNFKDLIEKTKPLFM